MDVSYPLTEAATSSRAEAAEGVADFLLYFCNEVTVTPSATGEANGRNIRQTDFTLSEVLFRADNGDGT